MKFHQKIYINHVIQKQIQKNHYQIPQKIKLVKQKVNHHQVIFLIIFYITIQIIILIITQILQLIK